MSRFKRVLTLKDSSENERIFTCKHGHNNCAIVACGECFDEMMSNRRLHVNVESTEPALADDCRDQNSVDIRPNWKFAMRVYIMALENGTEEGRAAARADLMALAAWVDDLPPQGNPDASEDNSNGEK